MHLVGGRFGRWSMVVGRLVSGSWSVGLFFQENPYQDIVFSQCTLHLMWMLLILIHSILNLQIAVA